MTVLSKAGSFNLSSSTGNQAITGLGFQPKVVIFNMQRLYTQVYQSVTCNTEASCFGAASSSSGRWCISDYNVPGGNNVDKVQFNDNKCIVEIDEFSGTILAADFVSMDADGFTINNVVASATARTVYYLALGGTDLLADVDVFTSVTATGTQAVTGVGFDPSALIFGHSTVGAADILQSGNVGSMSTSIALNPSRRGLITQTVDCSGAIANTRGVLVTDRVIGRVSLSNVFTESADLSSMDTDGFTVNWTIKSGTAFPIGYIALGGTARFGAGPLNGFNQGTVTANGGSTLQAITGAGAKPVAEIFISECRVANATPTTTLSRCIGFADSALNMSTTTTFELDQSTSNVNPRAQKTATRVLGFLDSNDNIVSDATLYSQDSDGFTFNWTTVDTVSRQFYYLWVASAITSASATITTSQTNFANAVSNIQSSRLVIEDRIKETSTTVGTDDFALAGAMIGFKPFRVVCQLSDTFYYAAQGVDINGNLTGDWEVGYGTYSATNTVARTLVLASSNNDRKVTFPAGTKQVWIDLAAYQVRSLQGGVVALPTQSTTVVSTLQGQGALAGAGGTLLMTGNTSQSNSVGATAALSTSGTYPVGQSPNGFTLVFEDHFNQGTTINTATWNVRTAPNSDRYNFDNATTQAARPLSYDVNNGGNSCLRIWPQVDSNGNFFHRLFDTSGTDSFYTNGPTKYSQTYGYFEMRAKLPKGQGVWPAFWLYDAHDSVLRPEFDIMEAYGDASGGGWSTGSPDIILNNYGVTTWAGDGSGEGPAKLYPTFPLTDLVSNFHVYGLKWTPSGISYYFDGNLLYTNTSVKSVKAGSAGMFVIVNLAYGSAAGNPTVSTTPQGPSNSYTIDYIRAWSIP